MSIEVKRRPGGSWCVFINGDFVSDHATQEAARIAARNHYIAAVRRGTPDGA